MRTYRKTIILLVVLGLLGGVYAFLFNKETDIKPEGGTTSSESILDVDKDKFTEVDITNEDGKFVFVKNDKDWVLSSPQDFKADKAKIDSIMTSLSFLSAEKVIDENASDLDQFGFNKPVDITVKYEGGSAELQIGNMTPTKEGYYIKKKDSNKVYTVSSAIGSTIVARKNDIRDKSLFTSNSDEITGLSLTKGSNLVFTIKKGQESEWNIIAPIDEKANEIQIGSILQSISKGSSYVNLVEEKPADIEKYDLKNPPYTIELETANGKTKLLIGSEKEKGKELYAKLSDKDEVFTIDESSMNFLDKPLIEIVDGYAYNVNINDVSKIIVDMDGKTTVSELVTDKEDSSKDKFTVNNKDANMKDDKDNSLFRNYYQALVNVAMDGIDLNSNPSGKPEITFTYTLKSTQGTMKIEFIPKDQDYYYVVKNGKSANILVKKENFNAPGGVREMQQKLLEALNKQ